MSEISTITVGGVTYDIKDETAREQIQTLNTTKANVTTVNTLDSRIDDVETDVTNLLNSVGSPLVAATKSAMTDHNKIYVYTGSESGMTSGNWYYWNGSAWTSGGVYNSTAFTTDTTLSVSGMAADAKVTGDEVTNLKSALNKETNAVASNFIGGDYFPFFIQGNTTRISGTDYLQNGLIQSDSISTDIKPLLC